jgi:hypothetical protein
LPEAVLESLQNARVPTQREPLPPLRRDRQPAPQDDLARRRRRFLAGLALAAAALCAIPDAGRLVADAPLVSWILGAIGLGLLWPTDTRP